MNTNYVITLGFNTFDAIKETTKRLYDQNNPFHFQHWIFDLSFPLVDGTKIPENIEQAKNENSIKIMELCMQYGSIYRKMDNVGVQQNWSKALQIIDIEDSDIVIGADCDEEVLQDGWVKAMGDSLRSGKIGLVSLLQEDIEQYILQEHYTVKENKSCRMWVMKSLLNMALIGMSGEFLNKINRTLPVPDHAQIYGHIEMLVHFLSDHGYDWAVLPDFVVFHNVQEGQLYREWKSWLIHQNISPQISFESWIKQRS